MKHERNQPRFELSKLLFPIVLITGLTITFMSIYGNSMIAAFVGLGLTFSAGVLMYVQPEQYVKRTLSDAVSKPALETLNDILLELNYTNKAIYLPPKYLRNPNECKAFILDASEKTLPTPEQILQTSNLSFVKSPKGLLLTPVGSGLLELFQENLGTDFIRTDLTHFQNDFPHIIEELGLAESAIVEFSDRSIWVRLQSCAYTEVDRNSDHYSIMGTPLSSAIACALTKVTGRPILIEKETADNHGNSVEIEFTVVEEGER